MKHLEVKYSDAWAVITSPTFMKHKAGEKLPYSVYKEMLKEFRGLEERLRKDGCYGWLMSTELDNTKMRRLITRLGGFMYRIDSKNNLAWFFKILK